MLLLRQDIKVLFEDEGLQGLMFQLDLKQSLEVSVRSDHTSGRSAHPCDDVSDKLLAGTN